MLPSNFYTDLAIEVSRLNEAVKSSLERATPMKTMPDRARLSAAATKLYRKVQFVIDEFGLQDIFTLIQRSHFLQPDEHCVRLKRSAEKLLKLNEYAHLRDKLLDEDEWDQATKEEADLFVRLALKDLTVSFIQIKVANNLIN